MKSQYQIWDERTNKFWIANIILAVIMLVAFIFDMYLWIKLSEKIPDDVLEKYKKEFDGVL